MAYDQGRVLSLYSPTSCPDAQDAALLGDEDDDVVREDIDDRHVGDGLMENANLNYSLVQNLEYCMHLVDGQCCYGVTLGMMVVHRI